MSIQFKKQQMRFICAKSYGTSHKLGKGTCKAYWEISNSTTEDGSWKVVEAKLKHDHEIDLIEVEVEGEGDIGDITDSEDYIDMDNDLDEDIGSIIQHRTVSLPKREIDSKVVRKEPASRKVEMEPPTILTFRTHGSIRKEMRKLIASGPLTFPTLANKISFASYEQFRIYASAAALQANYTLYLNNTAVAGANLKTFSLRCSRNHARFLPKERCTFEMKVKLKRRDVEGNEVIKAWRVVKEGCHSVVCLGSRGATVKATTSGILNVDSDIESSNLSSISPPPNSTNSTTSSNIKRSSSIIYTSSSIKRPRLPSPRTSALSSSSSSNSTSLRRISSRPLSPQIPLLVNPSSPLAATLSTVSRPINISELASFLYILSPPLSSHASLLHEFGINTNLSVMNLIISSSSESLNSLIQRLEEGGEIKLVQRMAFKERLKELREEVLDSMK